MGEWVVQLIEQSKYLGVAFLMFLETVFPPIPSELIMSIAGIHSSQGRMNIYGVIAAGTAGAMLGNIVWYLAARALGIKRLKPLVDRFGKWLTVNWSEVERAQRWFAKNGIFFVFLGRMLPTVRSLVSIPAGLLDMRFRSFFVASTLGTAAWTAMLAIAGYKLGENFEQVDSFLGPASNAVIAVLILGYVWRLITHKVETDTSDLDDSVK